MDNEEFNGWPGTISGSILENNSCYINADNEIVHINSFGEHVIFRKNIDRNKAGVKIVYTGKFNIDKIKIVDLIEKIENLEMLNSELKKYIEKLTSKEK